MPRVDLPQAVRWWRCIGATLHLTTPSPDEVHQRIDAHDHVDRFAGYHDEDFLLDIWTHGPAQSVAAATGLL